MRSRERYHLDQGVAMGCFCAALLFATSALAAEWPQYRGPLRDGRSAESVATTWPPGGPRKVWQAKLGTGYSGVVVAGGRLYTVFGQGGDELLAALDVATGKELWRLRLDSDRPDSMGAGPRSTPVVAGGRVFAVGARGKLVAADAASGAVAWKVDLVSEFGAKVPQWGISTSPLVEGDALMLDVGGRSGFSLMAFDAASGKVRWSSQADTPGYSSPLVITVGGLSQVLFFTGTSLVSVSPVDGKSYWRIPWETSYDVNAAMPVFIAPDLVFISSSYDKGAQVVRVKVQGQSASVEPVWRSRVMKNHFNSSVLVDGFLYGFDDGTLKCIEAATGTEKWKARGYGKGSLLVADGTLVVLSDDGQLVFAPATPAGFTERSIFQVLNGKTWTMPTLADGRLYLRSEGELVALDVQN